MGLQKGSLLSNLRMRYEITNIGKYERSIEVHRENIKW
jgi:hypothetical protein